MSEFQEKEINQAILIAEDENQLQPLTSTLPTSLLPLVNVPLLDYALETLNRSGVDEVFVFSNRHTQLIQEHIKTRISNHVTWCINMKIHVIGGGEGCRCFGDAMRDLDAKGLIRGNFILLTADTVTNVNLCKILEEHKKTTKYDRGAAATLILKPTNWQIRTGNELMVAINPQNKRLHYHRRLDCVGQKETQMNLPLEIFTQNAEIELIHGISDPQITIGSPTMLSLFSDNFDFESRDDFINGLLINEDILDSRIYVSLLNREEYARKVNNWLVYQLASRDIINRWAYPLVPDMGVISLTQQYVFLKNNIYRSPSASLLKVQMGENVVIQSGSSLGTGSHLTDSVIGRGVKIGQNCRLNHAYIFDNVQIGDNCVLEYCAVGPGTRIGSNSQLLNGTVIDSHCNIPNNEKLLNSLISNKDGINLTSSYSNNAAPVESLIMQNIDTLEKDERIDYELLEKANDDDRSALKIKPLPTDFELSDYISSSDESDVVPDSPEPDDDNIFLSEILDSMTRCFQEKSNPEFLILEINSSRYAYVMSLKDVNINVVKAMFSLPIIQDSSTATILASVKIVLKQLGPVLQNYIKDQDAMFDCLKGLEDIFLENEIIAEKFSNIIYQLYDMDVLSEEAILSWYQNLNDDDDNKPYAVKLRQNLSKFIDWLEQSSAESSEEDE